MADKPKRVLSEKQKEVLERNNFKNKTPAERSELGAKGAAATNKIKAEKVKLEDSPIFIWDLLFDTAEKFQKWFATLPPKEQKDVLLAILPKAKQTNEIIGSLGLEKVFITKEETKDTDNHIDDFINDES